MTAKQHAQAIAINPRTKAPFTVWQFVVNAVYLRQYAPLDSAAYAMEWAVKTGRMPSDMRMKLEALSPYRVVGLLVEMSKLHSTETQKQRLFELLG